MLGPSQSGASIWFGERDVVKTGSGAVGRRLVEQGAKMAGWSAGPPGVRVASVGGVHEGPDGLVSLRVGRVAGPGLMVACPRWVEHMEQVIRFVEHNLRDAADEDVAAAVEEKCGSVVESSRLLHGESPVYARVERALASVREPLPCGPCHGDLTLCNVLCDCATGGGIALVDMIHPFVDSPVLDAVKVRQDTEHHWLALFDGNQGVGARLDSCERALRGAFAERWWWRAWMRPLGALSLLRVLPYTPRGRLSGWVFRELEAIL